MLRWRIAISYLARQTLPVAIKAIERDIPVTNEQFSFLQSPGGICASTIELLSSSSVVKVQDRNFR
jgi:hypothetical protein